jgi:probable rRNA maturation factor
MMREGAGCPPVFFDTQFTITSLIVTRARAAGLNLSSLARFMSRASRKIGVQGEVNVLLTSSTEMRRLNSRYRKKRMPTDVLSFPALKGNGLAGDIAISIDIARRNARERNEKLEQEVCVLILHGLLHLAGYDHETDDGAMERKERQMRKSLALAPGLIERARQHTVSSRRINGASRRKTRSKAVQP